MRGLCQEVVGRLVKQVPDFNFKQAGLFTMSAFGLHSEPPSSILLLYTLGLSLVLILLSMYNRVLLS